MPEAVDKCLRSPRAKAAKKGPYAYCYPVLRNEGLTRYGEETARVGGYTYVGGPGSSTCRDCSQIQATLDNAILNRGYLPNLTVEAGQGRQRLVTLRKFPEEDFEAFLDKVGIVDSYLGRQPTRTGRGLAVWTV